LIWSLNNSTSLLNLLEPINLNVCKVVIGRIKVVNFRINNGGGNGDSCFEVEIWTARPTTKYTNIVAARSRTCGNYVGENKTFVKKDYEQGGLS